MPTHHKHVLTMLDCLRMQKVLHAWDPHIQQYRRMPELEVWRQRLQQEMATAVCFKIDNVAEMLKAGQEPGKEITVDIAKLPCLRPPYPYTWFEFSSVAENGKAVRIGVLMITGQLTLNQITVEIKLTSKEAQELSPERLVDAQGKVSYLSVGVFRQQGEQDVIGPLSDSVFLLNKHGALAAHGQEAFNCHKSEEPCVRGAMAVAFQALGLLHCRNVSVTEKDPPTTINERHRRKHPPMVKYKLLVVRPVQKQASQVAAPGTPGASETPYHICRGHFKTFDEKPLLGKVKGTFWWGHFARGNKKHGEVIKDYAVEPPEAEKPEEPTT